jgi:hypothetical protein
LSNQIQAGHQSRSSTPDIGDGEQGMKQIKPVGLQAASRKYDLLTALGAHGCHADKNLQRLVLRFMTLIVARYNWQHDDLSVGQREIAALWAVDERTVKREMAKLRDLGWLVQKRAAARGRVAVHGLDLAAILRTTKATWAAVGSDFVDRMQGPDEAPQPAQGNVVAFRPGTSAPLPEPVTAWDRARSRLHADDPAVFEAWFRQLQVGSSAASQDAIFELRAPSRFHASFVSTHHQHHLLSALRQEGLASAGVLVVAAQDS